MMQHSINENFNPMNIYAITKFAHKNISEFFLKKKKIKFYNLKLYETFGINDKRNKLLPTILKNYKKNKLTKILSKNLEMNFTDINEIISLVGEIVKTDLYKAKEYIIRNYKSENIRKLIFECNQRLNKKIKVKYLSSKNINVVKIKNFKVQNIILKSDVKNFILKNIH